MDEGRGLPGTPDSGKRGPWTQKRQAMVRAQLKARGIRHERVLRAMSEVPREEFVPPDCRAEAYTDRALSIGYGQTISQPYMVALMLELLDAQPDSRVLEVGAGSGYQAALLALLAQEVYALEIVEPLARRAEETLQRLGYDKAHIICGDGSLGYREQAPYDRIIVAAAAPEVPPPLLEQLVEGGRLVAPVGPRHTQQCLLLEKGPDGLKQVDSIGCVFVPLVGKHGWPNG